MKTTTKYRIKDSLSITLMVTLIFLVIHLVFELLNIDQFRSIGFSHGYLTTSGKLIVHHIVSYLLAFLVGFAALFYSSE